MTRKIGDSWRIVRSVIQTTKPCWSARHGVRPKLVFFQNFHSHVPPQTTVVCAVDLSHIARSHEFEEFIWAEPISNGQRDRGRPNPISDFYAPTHKETSRNER